VGFGNDGSETDGSFATETKFRTPFGADHGPDGSLYIVDLVRDGINFASRLRKIDPNGRVTLIAGISRNGGFSGDGGPAINARFSGLTDVAVAPDGTIYLADQFNSRVRWIDRQGIIHTLALGVGGSNDGKYVTGVAVSRDGAVYFTQQQPNAIYRVKGGKFTRIAGGDDIGIAYGLDVGPDGSVDYADTFNERVRRIAPDGSITTVLGRGAGEELFWPYDVDLDYQGNLYVADHANGKVKKLTPNGEVSVIMSELESPVGISVSTKDCGVAAVGDFDEKIFRYD
jgi:DNA-binding beta-propeller fold protein YncE